jgi:hypothetical protein
MMTAEILEDIIEAFPGFITDEPVNGGDLVEFIGDMITRYEANRPQPGCSLCDDPMARMATWGRICPRCKRELP